MVVVQLMAGLASDFSRRGRRIVGFGFEKVAMV